MASTSIREKIIARTVVVLQAVTSIEHVRRKVALSIEELLEMPATLFPLCCVTAGMPIPKNNESPRLYKAAQTSNVLSILSISIRTYGYDKSNPDTAMSSIADDIWDALYSDPTVNGLAESVRVVPVKTTLFFDPYFRFDFNYNVEYIHTTGGI